jgi:hypothetical protein
MCYGSMLHHQQQSKTTNQGLVEVIPFGQFSGLPAGLKPARAGLPEPGHEARPMPCVVRANGHAAALGALDVRDPK